MKWFYVITVEMPISSGVASKVTTYGTMDVSESASRSDVYKWVRDRVPSHMQSGNTIFYTAGPDEVKS